MASRISEIVVKAHEPLKLAEFWCEVLDFTVVDADDGAVEIGPDAGFGGIQPTVLFVPTDEPKTEPLRLHFDVNALDRDQNAELERLLALGARTVDIGQGDEVSWHVLADPEGNEFCLLRTQLEP